MSEFKFACPVCGQHMNADTAAAGQHLNCPTCFRTIVVPQPPASAESKLIVSASEAKRRGREAHHESATAGRRSRFPASTWIVIASVALCVAAGLAVTIWSGGVRQEQPTPIAQQPQMRQRSGEIGVGAWNTQVEYTNVTVTRDGKIVFDSNSGLLAKRWRTSGGQWLFANGLIQQKAIATDCRAIFGNTNWGDCAVQLRARKLGGAEGFLVLFHVVDDQNWTWWNLGGWNNTQHAIEHSNAGRKRVIGDARPGRIERGRWYDIRVELQGENIRCFLDGHLVHEVNYPEPL